MGRGRTALLLDLLFPQPCVACGESLLLDRAPTPWTQLPLCADCLAALAPAHGRRCRVCSLPLVSESELCTRCKTTRFPFVSNWALYEYRGLPRDLIAQYKFRNERSLGTLFAAGMAQTLIERFHGLPVVPVPSRPRSIRRRGWDHVGTIVDRIARAADIEVLRLLKRDNGRSQKTLDYSHRLTNLRGRIHWRPHGGAAPASVVLVDDVFTTGATASECSRVLLEHGVSEVFVLTIAVD